MSNNPLGCWAITWDYEADHGFRAGLAAVPVGYNVALLADGEEPPTGGEGVPGMDYRYLGLDPTGEGVIVQSLDPDTWEPEPPAGGEPHVRTWDTFDRIHIY
jgi:hypothetical protein